MSEEDNLETPRKRFNFTAMSICAFLVKHTINYTSYHSPTFICATHLSPTSSFSADLARFDSTIVRHRYARYLSLLYSCKPGGTFKDIRNTGIILNWKKGGKELKRERNKETKEKGKKRGKKKKTRNMQQPAKQ